MVSLDLSHSLNNFPLGKVSENKSDKRQRWPKILAENRRGNREEESKLAPKAYKRKRRHNIAVLEQQQVVNKTIL